MRTFPAPPAEGSGGSGTPSAGGHVSLAAAAHHLLASVGDASTDLADLADLPLAGVELRLVLPDGQDGNDE